MTLLLCTGLLSLTAYAKTDYGSILHQTESIRSISVSDKEGTLSGGVLSFRQLGDELVTAAFSMKGERLSEGDAYAARKAGLEDFEGDLGAVLAEALTDKGWFGGDRRELEGLYSRGDETWYINMYLVETASVGTADGALDELGRLRYGLEAAGDAAAGASRFYVALHTGDVYGAVEGAFDAAAGIYGVYLAFTDDSIGWDDEPQDGTDLAGDVLVELFDVISKGGADLEEESEEPLDEDEDEKPDEDDGLEWAIGGGESDDESSDDGGDSKDCDEKEGCDDGSDDESDDEDETNDPDDVRGDAETLERYMALMATLGLSTSPYSEDVLIERSCPGGWCTDTGDEDISVLILDIECDPLEEVCSTDDRAWIDVTAVNVEGVCRDGTCGGRITAAPVTALDLGGAVSTRISIDTSSIQSMRW